MKAFIQSKPSMLINNFHRLISMFNLIITFNSTFSVHSL